MPGWIVTLVVGFIIRQIKKFTLSISTSSMTPLPIKKYFFIVNYLHLYMT